MLRTVQPRGKARVKRSDFGDEPKLIADCFMTTPSHPTVSEGDFLTAGPADAGSSSRCPRAAPAGGVLRI